MVLSLNENSERKSNPVPYSLYLYLSGSTFLVSFTDQEKYFAPLRILNLLIKYIVNLFVDIALTFFDSSFNSFLFDVTFFSLLSKSVFFTKLAISFLLAKFACFSLAVTFADVKLIHS